MAEEQASIPFTQKMLVDWAGSRKFREGKALFDRGVVSGAEYDAPHVRGYIERGGRQIKTGFRILKNGSIESECPCYDNRERGIICSHVVALGLAMVRRASDPHRAEKLLQESRHARRMAQYEESDYIQRAKAGTPDAVAARLQLQLAGDWAESLNEDRVTVRAFIETRGERIPAEEVSRDILLAFDETDEALLYVLEDICEGPLKNECALKKSDFIGVLQLLQGRSLQGANGDGEYTVNAASMGSVLMVDLDRETGELILRLHTELPHAKALDHPLYMVNSKSGWTYAARHFWPLDHVLPAPFRALYSEPIVIAREDVLRFLNNELPVLEESLPVQSEVTPDLFTIEPAKPAFHLEVKGSPASLSGLCYAVYGTLKLTACKPSTHGQFAVPDPDDLLRYMVRSEEREEAGLKRLSRTGMVGVEGDDLEPIVGCREVLNFLGRDMPALKRKGWSLSFKGRISATVEKTRFVTPVVYIDRAPGADGWFDVRFSYEDAEGHSLKAADIQRALLKNESYIERGDDVLLLDSRAIEQLSDVFRDCASREGEQAGSFRVSELYASYVKSSLDALDGVDVEADAQWIEKAERMTDHRKASAPVVLREDLERILRPYQKVGVQWLRFWENNGFCGILADEMGLGKTVQALAWLEMERSLRPDEKRPSLIICPTSLVENWQEEAERFTPSLKTLILSGAERHEQWAHVRKADLVISSYALLRRDIERYKEHEFAAMILDEAQHIKNRATQNAQAAKSVLADHRLVLTGTPIENGVSDLWSIMDFLMPGYLGAHPHFRKRYELPIGKGGEDAEAAQNRLRRKLKPFLVRRLKSEVARDLPPKIQRIAHCTLTSDQKHMYKMLLDACRHRAVEMVEERGFDKSRMEILQMLMRLRQVCCHLDLLKLSELDPEKPSAKMDLFFELLDEAIDAGHRVLVFSQFVSMLTILRKEMESRSIPYCYLDGSTKERMSIVRQFNTDRSIPVFLISLKAGGTGLNLTGADMVIHFDPWWNPAVEDQATDRAYRIGQKRTVYSIKLITRGTVEEKVLALQKRKQDVIDATLAGHEQEADQLSWDEVKDLLEVEE